MRHVEPCFELWLYLHFRDQHGYVTSEQMARLLEGCECGYNRNSKLLSVLNHLLLR